MLRKVSKVKFFGKFEVTWSLLAHIGGSNDGGSDPVVTRESNICSFDNTRQTHPRAIRHEAGQTPPVFTEKLPSATEPTDYFSVNVEMWTSSSEWRVTTWSVLTAMSRKYKITRSMFVLKSNFEICIYIKAGDKEKIHLIWKRGGLE